MTTDHRDTRSGDTSSLDAHVSPDVHPLLAARGTSAATDSQQRTHSPKNRKAMIVFVVVGAVTCLLLGYWQLSRWNSAQGSFQNLGYALEWPFFAAFLVFAYRRWVRLEDGKKSAEAEGLSAVDAGLKASPHTGKRSDGVQTEIPTDFLPPRRSDRESMHEQQPLDAGLREYNAYLANISAPKRKDS